MILINTFAISSAIFRLINFVVFTLGGYVDTVNDFSQGVLAEVKSDEMSDTSKDFTSK